MYVRRGVLPISALSPVYTFGAPAVFCEGGAGGACACRAGSSGCGDGGILQALGLPEGAVRCACAVVHRCWGVLAVHRKLAERLVAPLPAGLPASSPACLIFILLPPHPPLQECADEL